MDDFEKRMQKIFEYNKSLQVEKNKSEKFDRIRKMLPLPGKILTLEEIRDIIDIIRTIVDGI